MTCEAKTSPTALLVNKPFCHLTKAEQSREQGKWLE